MHSSPAERKPQQIRQYSATPLDRERANARMQQRQSPMVSHGPVAGSQFSGGGQDSLIWSQQALDTSNYGQHSPRERYGARNNFDDSPRTPVRYDRQHTSNNITPLSSPSSPFPSAGVMGERGVGGIDSPERVDFLYARFYGYVRNPTGWQHKMDFWVSTLDSHFQRNPSLILFTPRQLEQHFELNGIRPKCMRRVLIEMMRKPSGHAKPEITAFQEYFTDFSWAAWGFDMLFNKPFSMAFVLIKWSLSSMFSFVTASIAGSDSPSSDGAGIDDPSIDDRDTDAAAAARDLDDQAELIHRSNLDRFIVQLKRDIADKKVFSAQKFHSPNIFSFDEYTHEIIPYTQSYGINDTRVAALALRHLCSHFDAVVESPVRHQPYHQQILSLLPNPEKSSVASTSHAKAAPVSTAEILIKLSPTLFPASAAALSTAPSLRDVKSSNATASASALTITERDKVRRSLQLQIDKFEQQFEALEQERARLRDQAREFVKAQRKVAALRSLRKSKLLQVRTETLTKHIDNLEHMLGSIEDAEQNASLFEIVKMSKRALEKAQSDITIEQVEQIMDDINERIELNEQIGEALATGATPMTTSPSSKTAAGKAAAVSDEDQDLERELAELLSNDKTADDLADSIAKLKVLDTSITDAEKATDDDVVEVAPPEKSADGKKSDQAASTTTVDADKKKESKAKVALSSE